MSNKNYTIKTINSISPKGLELLKPNFAVSEVDDNPDAILVRSADLHGEEFSENLLYIGRAGAGVNNIPIEKCSEQGIVVCNAPGANANAVKELVAAALLISSRNIIEAVDWTRSLNGTENIEKEVEAGKKNFIGPELVGKNLGVIGLGAVGGLVADMGIKFGMNVYGYDPYLSLESALHLNTSIEVVTDVKEIFKNCDYISLHTSLTPETKHLVNKELFDLGKPGLRLMNFARGELVNLEDLKVAIEEKQVEKYICDFPCQE
ncbi:MAG: 3-phosphoglycerate dehydrogenase, partial [Tissierellia bacterium]|nr:3-phosphoglycerate dehydrogenase [Tissierellia bacterium]